MTNPVAQLIDLMNDARKASVAKWAEVPALVELLPQVMPSHAGYSAVILAGSARGLLRQLPLIDETSRAAMRMTLLSLSDVLAAELSKHGVQPYHLKD